jgi:hypothetical protein
MKKPGQCSWNTSFRAGKIGSKFGRAFGIVPSALVHQGSQITHPGALHNAEVPSFTAARRKESLAVHNH